MSWPTGLGQEEQRDAGLYRTRHTCMKKSFDARLWSQRMLEDGPCAATAGDGTPLMH